MDASCRPRRPCAYLGRRWPGNAKGGQRRVRDGVCTDTPGGDRWTWRTALGVYLRRQRIACRSTWDLRAGGLGPPPGTGIATPARICGGQHSACGQSPVQRPPGTLSCAGIGRPGGTLGSARGPARAGWTPRSGGRGFGAAPGCARWPAATDRTWQVVCTFSGGQGRTQCPAESFPGESSR